MEVGCSSTLPVVAFGWRTRAGQRYVTVVCKATYVLAPGRSWLAASQDPIPRPGRDGRGERVPFKPRSDVLLSGSAWAPERRPTRRVVARLVVADVDKMVAVVGDRVRDASGNESEPEPFLRMPLDWERAAGGPDTWNPVGVGHREDESGRTALPNLVGIDGNESVPAGFGPIPARWAPRAQYAGGGAVRVDHDDAELEDGIDPLHFQLALPDQQARAAFDPDTHVVLEHLHPEHARLVTNLTALTAVVTVASGRGERKQPLLADTLWIDTDRSRAWMVLRAVVPLAEGEAPRLHVTTTGASSELESDADAERSDTREISVAPEDRLHTREIATLDEASPVSERGEIGALPFRGAAVPRVPGPVLPVPKQATVPRQPVPVPMQPSALPVTSALAAVRPELPPGERPVPTVAGSARAAEGGVLSASNDAAGSAQSAERARREIKARVARVALEGPRDADDQARDPLELLWFLPTLALRQTPALAAVLGDPVRRRFADAPVETSEETRVRRDVMKVLVRAPITSPTHLEALHVASVDDDGGVRPPLVVVSGEMAARFDDRDALRATVGVASPFAPLDKALREACDLATAIADSEWSGAASLELAHQRLREALARAARDVGAQRLEATVQRKLLERRRFLRVTLRGSPWLRFDLVSGDGRGPMPLYLPGELADLVPLFERLPIRAVAELRRRQDEAEAHPDALFVQALGRWLGNNPASRASNPL